MGCLNSRRTPTRRGRRRRRVDRVNRPAIANDFFRRAAIRCIDDVCRFRGRTDRAAAGSDRAADDREKIFDSITVIFDARATGGPFESLDRAYRSNTLAGGADAALAARSRRVVPGRMLEMPCAGVEEVAEFAMLPMEFRKTPMNIHTTPIFFRELRSSFARPALRSRAPMVFATSPIRFGRTPMILRGRPMSSDRASTSFDGARLGSTGYRSFS
jgi:hypothetical protein